MSEAIKDEELAEEVRQAEAMIDSRRSRQRVREAIERRYTAPVSKGSGAGADTGGAIKNGPTGP